MIEQNIEVLKELRQKYQSMMVELNKAIAALEADKMAVTDELEQEMAGYPEFKEAIKSIRRIKLAQDIELSNNKNLAKARAAFLNSGQGSAGNGAGNNNGGGNSNGNGGGGRP
jgi:hypothetical protein